VASQAPQIRAAVAADAPAIRGLIRRAQLNPLDLHWRRFLVADDHGEIVACAQVRVHRGGTRELASVTVASSHRGRGVGRLIGEAAIAREPVRPLYLYTESKTEAFWAKFGFRRVEGDAIPRDLRGSLRIARVAAAVFSWVARAQVRIVVMRRDEP
jgi:N-acetylglutamate synthase-like GNAT family acetyltransferase